MLAEVLKIAMREGERKIVQMIYEFYPTTTDSDLDFLLDDDDDDDDENQLIIDENMIDLILMKPNLGEEWIRKFAEMLEQGHFADSSQLLTYLKARRPNMFAQNKRRKI